MADPRSPPEIAPMEARLTDSLPVGADWAFEPKWDGFRCVAYRDDAAVTLLSKSGKPLGRFTTAGRARCRCVTRALEQKRLRDLPFHPQEKLLLLLLLLLLRYCLATNYLRPTATTPTTPTTLASPLPRYHPAFPQVFNPLCAPAA